MVELLLPLLAASSVLVAGTLLWLSWRHELTTVVKSLPEFGDISPWTMLLDVTLGIRLFLIASETRSEGERLPKV
jgi:hypothetical protein